MSKNSPFLPKVNKMIYKLFPNIPFRDCAKLTTRISKRAVKDPHFEIEPYAIIKAMTVAYIRHTKTNYDSLSSLSKEDARVSIGKEVSQILYKWRGER